MAFLDSDSGFAASGAGHSSVTVTLAEWHDASRAGRSVPVKIYSNLNATTGTMPVIIVSHGLGGTRDAMEYLGRAWAQAGYVSVHLQHAGSDDGVWKNSTEPMKDLAAATTNLDNAVKRGGDVHFAIDELGRINQTTGPLYHRLDLKRIGMAGHSFGAFTTLAVAGQRFPWLRGDHAEASMADPRVSAAIALSPVPPEVRTSDVLKKAYGHIHIPILHMTGTDDVSPIRETEAADRRLPFDNIKLADQYLVTFNDGNHGLFGGRERLGPEGKHDDAYRPIIAEITTRYWNAYLKGDKDARKWLRDSSGARALLVKAQAGTLESHGVPGERDKP